MLTCPSCGHRADHPKSSKTPSGTQRRVCTRCDKRFAESVAPENIPPDRPRLDAALLKYAQTPRQREAVQAVIDHGEVPAAAESLSISERSLYKLIATVKNLAARRGYSPEHGMVHEIPDGFKVRGHSTLHHAEKGQLLQWVKTSEDRERQLELIREAVEEMCRSVPRIEPRDPRSGADAKLMSVLPMGDPHFGMYAWAEETGDSFDLSVARRDLCGAVDYLVRRAPRSGRALIINVGDFFHADNMEGMTTKSGNILDMDTRLPKMVRVGVAAMRQCIETALDHHEVVEVINTVGNHDEVLSFTLSIMLSNIYENEPRVVIHDQPTKRHYVRHGQCLIGSVHGHQTKDPELPGIMATERPKDWGDTKFRRWFRGHHHQDRVSEFNGCTVEQVQTLAAGDSHAVAHGYLSGRSMKNIVFDSEVGEVERYNCSIDLLRRRQAA